jgi:hypothetical protein
MSTPKNQTIKNFPSIARVDSAGNITGIVVENANVANVLNLTGDQGVIAAKPNGTIVLSTTDSSTQYSWSFDSAGGMIIPGNLLIAPGLAPQGTIINQENAELQIVSTNVAGSLSLGWADSVFANNAAFMSFNSSPGNIEVIAGNLAASPSIWTYDNTGNLTLPDNGSIIGPNKQAFWNYANGGLTVTANIENDVSGISFSVSSDTGVYANANVMITANAGAANSTGFKNWTFAADGNLVLPGNTFSVRYANGGQVPLDNMQAGIANGISSVNIPVADGNVITTAGTKQWNFSTGGNLVVPGDLVGPANANFTVFANAGQHEFVFGEDGTFYAPDNVVFGGTSIAIGPGANSLVPELANAIFVASSNADPYIQAVVNNVSDNGSADWVAMGHRGNDDGGWADFGFTSSGFGDANYSITGQGDGYFFVQSYLTGQSPGGRGGNLVLATGEQGTVKDIIFATGGFLTGNEFARIDHANNRFWLTRAGSGIKFADGTTQTTAAVNTAPGGATTQIQFNDAGVFGGDSGLTYNKTTDSLTAVGNITAGNLFTGGNANITGNANVGNLNAAAQVVATGNVRGANIYSQTGLFAVAGLGAQANFAPASAVVKLGIGATTMQLGGDVTTTSATGNVEMYGNVAVGYMISELVPYNDGQHNLGRESNRWGNLYVSNLASFSDAANVKIQGGSNGQFLRTDGVGNLSWSSISSDSISNGTSNVSIPVVNGNIRMSVSGGGDRVVISTTSANFAGNIDVLGFGRFSGNLTGGNLVTSGVANITGNANVGNLNAAAQVVATGNVRGGNIYSQTGLFAVSGLGAAANFAPASAIVKLGIGATTMQLGGDVTTTSATGNVEMYGNVAIGYMISEIVPYDDGQYNLGRASNRWGNLYVSNVASFGDVSNVKIQGGTDGQVLKTDGAGNLAWVTSSGSPGGSNTEIQFNSNGNFAGDSNLTWNSTTRTLYSNNFIASNIQNLGYSNAVGVINMKLPALGNITFGNPGMADKAGLIVLDSLTGTVQWGYSDRLTSTNEFSEISIENDYAKIVIASSEAANISGTVANFAGNISAPSANVNSLTVNSNTIALGYATAVISPGTDFVAIGSHAAQQGGGNRTVSIGYYAGYYGANVIGDETISIGSNAGAWDQDSFGVAIGPDSGVYFQSTEAVAIGRFAGYGQNSNIAAGQKQAAIAIGSRSGSVGQGQFAIAIGANSGRTISPGSVAQANNSIVLNATGTDLNASTASTLIIKPVRNNAGTSPLYYDSGTGEVTYSDSGNIAATSIVTSAAAPASSGSPGTTGQIIANGSYIYYHTGTGWLRIQGTTF